MRRAMVGGGGSGRTIMLRTMNAAPRITIAPPTPMRTVGVSAAMLMSVMNPSPSPTTMIPTDSDRDEGKDELGSSMQFGGIGQRHLAALDDGHSLAVQHLPGCVDRCRKPR